MQPTMSPNDPGDERVVTSLTVPYPLGQKKPTWRNTRRYSATSAYSSTSPPATCRVALHLVVRRLQSRSGPPSNACPATKIITMRMRKATNWVLWGRN